MKKTLFALSVSLFPLLLLVGGASVALAAGPSTLSFFCDDYTQPFTPNGVYQPLSNTNCNYNLPAIASSSIETTVYQGTPGAATALGFGFLSSPNAPTLFVQNGVAFGAPANGANYFAVAYGWDSFSEVTDADAFFSSGGGAAPAQYYILPFTWGTALSVTADNQSVTSGDPLPTFTATLAGFLGGDTQANSTTGAASCTTTAANTATAGDFPITCTQGTLASTKYSFSPFVDGTLHIAPAPPPPPPTDTQPPVITITNPLKNGVYAKTDSVLLTATVTDASPLATTTYWLGTKQINPAKPLPLSGVSTPSVQSVSVSATDIHGNTATSTLKFFVVKSTNSCLLDIVQVLIMITQDKTLPDKPTIQNLIADCSALIKGLHRYDDDGHGHH